MTSRCAGQRAAEKERQTVTPDSKAGGQRGAGRESRVFLAEKRGGGLTVGRSGLRLSACDSRSPFRLRKRVQLMQQPLPALLLPFLSPVGRLRLPFSGLEEALTTRTSFSPSLTLLSLLRETFPYVSFSSTLHPLLPLSPFPSSSLSISQDLCLDVRLFPDTRR